MLNENKRTLLIASILTCLPLLAGLYYWNQLPDPMAVHFGMNNEPDGFSSKSIAVFGFPLFGLAILWLGAFVTASDPKRKNISPKMFSLVLWIVPVIMNITAAFMYAYNLGWKTDMTFAAELLLGILFVVIGNYLPKARQNYSIGIKIPWTLADEDNWNRTHRFAGYLYVAGGILLVIFAFTGMRRFEVLFGLILVITLIPVVYSYRLAAAHS